MMTPSEATSILVTKSDGCQIGVPGAGKVSGRIGTAIAKKFAMHSLPACFSLYLRQ
jgi:hypothetical protein